MTPSVYVIGGAGAGKSTFVAQLWNEMGPSMGPLVDLHMKRNAKGTPVVLRGHELADGGLYLGCMRDSFPGTDGLDRASSMTGTEWLANRGADRYAYIIAEGATLSTRPFLGALDTYTDLLLVHLWVEEWLAECRFAARGSSQNEQFVQATVTRSRNRLEEFKAENGLWASVDTSDPEAWRFALDMAVGHLSQNSSPEG